jgi:hypothetical protein
VTPTADPRALEYVPLGDLLARPAARNPKRHQLDDIAASIRRFGYVAPSTQDERTGLLVAGHGRLEALALMQANNEPPPEGIVLDAQGEWRVPHYRGWRSADDVEAEAYLVADNELTMAAGWMRDPLADVLSTVQRSPAGLGGTGFTDERLSTLMAELGRTAPSFAPLDDGSSSPRLDQLAPDVVECPHCHQSFDRRQL